MWVKVNISRHIGSRTVCPAERATFVHKRVNYKLVAAWPVSVMHPRPGPTGRGLFATFDRHAVSAELLSESQDDFGRVCLP